MAKVALCCPQSGRRLGALLAVEAVLGWVETNNKMRARLKTIVKRIILHSLVLLLCSPLAAAERPNILVVLVDDMGWSDISPYGGEIHTPTLERLAENGLRFRHFYNEARCAPTRIALMTGLHMQTAGVDPNASLPNLRTDNNATIPELLGGSGYRTYFAGKWHLGTLANARDPISRGFQHAFGQGPNADGAGNDYWALGFTYNLVSSNNEITPTNYPPGTFYKTDADADYVLKFLDHHYAKQDGKPFFIYLACNAPHFRLQAPVEYTTNTPMWAIRRTRPTQTCIVTKMAGT